MTKLLLHRKMLLLIDGNAIIHRAYHALPPLSANDGSPINAVYGFISMLLGVIQTLKPTHIIVAWDTPKPTFRHSQYSNYQAQRPRGDSELISQFAIARKVLESMNIPQYSLEGFEADDVIGTIANQLTQYDQVNDIVIVTGDRDILQLVNDTKHISLYMPIKGLSNAKLYHELDVVDRMGVKADQIIDYKALVGDPSDNYPGVAGIGEKTAINLLNQFGNVDQIYNNLHLIPDKYAKKLAEGAEPAGVSRMLATIVQDVPITAKLDEASKWDVSSERTVKLFREIGFKTLTNRILNFKK